jgi:ABC-type sugar transport system substrate-binding protein
MKKYVFLVTLLLIFSLALVGCGELQGDTTQDVETEDSDTDAETLTIGISVRNIENPYYIQVKEGVEMFTKYIEEKNGNVNFDIQFIACDSSDEQQISDVQSIIARGGEDTIIYIDPNNASVCSSVARICEENNVYWCSVWSYADGVYPYDYDYYAFYQSPGEVEVEAELCLDMFADFNTPNEGNVLFIKGLEGNTASGHRYEGFCEAVEQTKGIEVLDVQNGDWNPQTAQDLTTTWLNKFGAENIDAIVCANDEMALAVVETLKAEGLNGKIHVTGFDGIDAAVKATQAGDMYGTVGANPYVEGGQGVAYLYACWSGELDLSTLSDGQRSFLTEPELITQHTVDDFVNKTVELDFENYLSMIYEELDLRNYE